MPTKKTPAKKTPAKKTPVKKMPVKMKKISLALQGGGAHGAFTWGVLDKLLEDGRVEIEAISATSAGSLNAAIMVAGMAKGGPDTARENLEIFWQRVSQAGSVFNPVHNLPFEKMLAMNPLFSQMSKSLAFQSMENFTHIASPYQFNPLDINPLRDILEEMVDIKALHACTRTDMFITATNVKSGNGRVFRKQEVTIDAIMASAALPFLYRAVEIGKDAYWDGGYMGNPSLWPLFYHARSRDILLVHVNPIVRDDIPDTPIEIDNRLNEITFNSSLLHEMRAIAFVQKLLHNNMLKPEYRDHYKDVILHAIRTDAVMNELSVSTKYDTDWEILRHLRDLGRRLADAWLTKHYADINVRQTINIQRDYMHAPYDE